MNQGILFLLLSGAFIFLLAASDMSGNQENFVEMRGGAGYTTPISQINIDYDVGVSTREYKLNFKGITADEVNMCVTKTSEFIKEQTGVCNTVIETNRMQLFKNENGDKLFKCAFMYMTTSTNFPFGFSVNVDILGDGRIIRASTETMSTNSIIKPYNDTNQATDNFLPATELSPKPNLNRP